MKQPCAILSAWDFYFGFTWFRSLKVPRPFPLISRIAASMPHSDSSAPYSLLSASEVLEALEQASVPSDVQRIIRQADEATVTMAWSMLSPAQRGALLLVRRFQGSSIMTDDDACETDNAE